jgi:hypothetical protein
MRHGYWVGRSPFGYAIEGDRYRKTLVPAATPDYEPAIYARATKGESLQKIADWLTAEGVETVTGQRCVTPGHGSSRSSATPPTRARTVSRRGSRRAALGRPTDSSLRIVS